MDPLAPRVAERFASRPVPLDKAAIRALAEDLAKKVAAYAARQPPEHLLGRDSKMLEWSWKAKTVKEEDIAVNGYFYSAPSSSSNLVTGGQTVENDLLDEGDVTVRIRLNGSRPYADFTDGESTGGNGLPYLINDVLVHELTHVAEWWYLSQKKQQPHVEPELRGEERRKSDIAYYNAPHEVRAYMQQIIEEILPRARGFKRVLKPKTPHEYILKLLNTSVRWKQVRDYLTPANEAKILKATYDALDKGGYL